MVRAAVQGKHAEPLGHQVVEPAVAEQNVMHRFVGQAAQLVLAGFLSNLLEEEAWQRHVGGLCVGAPLSGSPG